MHVLHTFVEAMGTLPSRVACGSSCALHFVILMLQSGWYVSTCTHALVYVEFLRKFLLEKSAGTPAQRSPSPETPQEGPTITKVRPGLKAVFTEMQKFKVGLQRWNLAQKVRRFELYRSAETDRRNKVENLRKVPRHVCAGLDRTRPAASSLAPAVLGAGGLQRPGVGGDRSPGAQEGKERPLGQPKVRGR